MGVIHFLKEGNEKIEEHCGEKGCEAAYAFIIMVLSYMMMLFIMQVLTSHSHVHESEKQQPYTEESQPVNTALPVASQTEESTPSSDTTKEEKAAKEQSTAVAAGLMTFFSLSVHGVFLGLALGIDNTLTGILNVAIGILAHKWADTLALSFVLRRSKSKYIRPLIMVPLQSLVSPIGIIVGMFISEAKSDFLEGFFLCMTAGCFVYFFASDIVTEVFHGKAKLLKFCLAMLGICVFTVAVSVGEHYSGD